MPSESIEYRVVKRQPRYRKPMSVSDLKNTVTNLGAIDPYLTTIHQQSEQLETINMLRNKTGQDMWQCFGCVHPGFMGIDTHFTLSYLAKIHQ